MEGRSEIEGISSPSVRFFLSYPAFEVAMEVFCRFCGLSNFRISRFRFRASDLSRLLLLRLPVRCMNCDQRIFLFLPQFLKLRNELRVRHQERHGSR